MEQNPAIVTAAKSDLEKERRVERLTEQMLQMEQLRQRQRDEHLRLRREAMRKDAEEANNLTIRSHKFSLEFEKKQKAREGRFINAYAPETLMASLEKSGRASPNQSADVVQMLDRKLTGLTKVDPYRITTVRQKTMYDDEMRRIEADRQKKAQLRADLENQMKAKVFKREKERLYLDEKSLVTSKGLLLGVGASLPD